MRQHKESAQSLSYHIALGGIIAALCIACMFLTGVFPMFYLILPMLASAFIYIMVLETSGYWGFLTYLSVGLLSIFVTPNKDASLAFLFFFGYFPLLRHLMEPLSLEVRGIPAPPGGIQRRCAGVLLGIRLRTGHEGAAGIPGRLRQIRAAGYCLASQTSCSSATISAWGIFRFCTAAISSHAFPPGANRES